MLSLPLATGGLQPNTASQAFHGVSRSICARTMPSRKSAARTGNSSGRNRNRFGCRSISTRLPLNSGARLAAEKLPSANASCRGRFSDLPAVSTAKLPLSCSISRIRRGDDTRSNAAITAAATLSVQPRRNVPMGCRNFIANSWSSGPLRRGSTVGGVAPRQYTIGLIALVEKQDYDLRGAAPSALEIDGDGDPVGTGGLERRALAADQARQRARV